MRRWGWAAVAGVIVVGLGLLGFGLTRDPGSRTAIDFGVYGVPETYFIARDGRVAAKHIGPLSTEALRGRIDSLLAAGNGPARPGVATPPGDRNTAGGRTGR